MSDYAGGTIWGMLDTYTQKYTAGGREYIEMKIDCPHEEYGNVRVLGRLYGDAIRDLLEHYKKGSDLRIEGIPQQYDGRNGIRKTSFSFYRLIPGKPKEYKAAFRIEGTVESVETQNLASLLKLSVNYQSEGYPEQRETYEVYVPDSVALEMEKDVAPGDRVKVKGYMTAPEDEYGERTDPQRLEARKIEIVD